MAGIQQTQARRSQLLERLLKERPRGSIESPGQLIAELGAQFIRQKKAKKLQAEEEAEQKKAEAALLAALTGRQPDSSITLEGIGDDPDEEILSPGRKVGIERAVAQLPPDQQVQALQILGLRKDVASQPKVKKTASNFIDAETGQAHAGSFDNGVYRTSSGKVIEHASPIAPAAGQKDLENNLQSFRPVQAATATALGEIDNLLKQLDDSPKPETLVSYLASATRGISSIANQARAAAAMFSGVKAGQSLKAIVNGETVNETALFNTNLYDFGDAASESAAFQGNVLNLAYAIMRSLDPGGRLSDRDVQTGINIITGGDTQQTIAKLKEARRRTVSMFRNDALSRDLKGQLDSFEQRFGISLEAPGQLSTGNDARLKALGL